MPSSHNPGSKTLRRMLWLAIILLVVGVLYSAGWYYAAGILTERANAEIAGINGAGVRASCENLEPGGYPLGIGVTCNSVLYENTGAGLFFSADGLSSSARIHAPSVISSNIKAPAQLEVPGLVPLDLDWDHFTTQTHLARPLPSRLAMSARQLRVTVSPGYSFASGELFSAQQAETEIVPVGNDIAVKSELTGLSLAVPSSGARFDASIDVSVKDGVTRIKTANSDPRNLAADIRSLTFQPQGGGSVTLKGPLSVDGNGLLNGAIEVSIDDPQKLSAALETIFPAEAGMIRSALAMAATTNGQPAKITLRVNKGDLYAGFFLIAKIPPL